MKLKLVKSDVILCTQCNTWIIRSPQWCNGELGKGHACHKCGCTSTTEHEGRPWGPRSEVWPDLLNEFNDLYHCWDHPDEREWFLSTVVVEGA